MITKMDLVLYKVNSIGTQSYSNGDEYEGEWREGKRAGEGINEYKE